MVISREQIPGVHLWNALCLVLWKGLYKYDCFGSSQAFFNTEGGFSMCVFLFLESFGVFFAFFSCVFHAFRPPLVADPSFSSGNAAVRDERHWKPWRSPWLSTSRSQAREVARGVFSPWGLVVFLKKHQDEGPKRGGNEEKKSKEKKSSKNKEKQRREEKGFGKETSPKKVIASEVSWKQSYKRKPRRL